MAKQALAMQGGKHREKQTLKTMKTAQENCLETFRELSRRINHAKTKGEMEALESKMDKLYNAGCLTVKQLQRLDGQIMDALARKGGA